MGVLPQESEEGESGLMPFKMRAIRGMVIGLIVFTVILVGGILIFVPIDERVSGAGYVRAERDTYLYAKHDGVLGRVCVKEGEIVKEGDPLIQMDDTALQDQLKQIEARIEKGRSDLEYQETNLDRIRRNPLPKEFWHLHEELGGAQEKVKREEEDYRRVFDLSEKGLLSKHDLEQSDLALYLAKSEESKVQEKIKIVEQGLEKSILNQASAERKSVYSTLGALETERKIILSEIERSLLRAPEAGFVTLIEKKRPGIKVERGEELMHLAHGEINRVEILIGQSQYHRLKVGQRVSMKSKSFDAFRYGYVEGEVIQVALEPQISKEEGKKQESTPQYRIVAKVDSTPQKLVLGSTVEVRIIIRRVALWRFLLPN